MILKPAKAATVSTSKFVLNIEGGTSRLRLMDKFREGCHNIPKKMPIYGGWAWKQSMTLSLMLPHTRSVNSFKLLLCMKNLDFRILKPTSPGPRLIGKAADLPRDFFCHTSYFCELVP